MIQYVEQLGNEMNAGRVLAAAVAPINVQQRRGGRMQAVPAEVAPAPVALPQMIIEIDKRIFDIHVKCEEDVIMNQQSKNTRKQEWTGKHLKRNLMRKLQKL